MNKLLRSKAVALSATALFVASTTGCGCCGIFSGRSQTVAMPTVTGYAPACAPACDTCNGGQQVFDGAYDGQVYGEPTMAPFGG